MRPRKPEKRDSKPATLASALELPRRNAAGMAAVNMIAVISMKIQNTMYRPCTVRSHGYAFETEMSVQRSRPGITAHVHSRHSPRLNETPSAGDLYMTSACGEVRRGGRARQRRCGFSRSAALSSRATRRTQHGHAPTCWWRLPQFPARKLSTPRRLRMPADCAQASRSWARRAGRPSAMLVAAGSRCGASECEIADGATWCAESARLSLLSTKSLGCLASPGVPARRHHSAAHFSACLPRAPTFAALRPRS